MTRTTRLAATIVALAVGTAAGVPGSLAADNNKSAPELQSGSCLTTRTSFVQSVTLQSGNASSFVPVAASLVNFTITGTTNTCVIVTFSAVASGLVAVRALLDNNPSFDGQVMLRLASGGEAGTYSFVFPNVRPGPHSVFLQWRSPFGTTIAISRFTVLVQYR